MKLTTRVRLACSGPLRLATALLTLLLFAGCTTGYEMTLSNGKTITSANKPKFDSKSGVYRFKDARGDPRSIPAFRVQNIEPRSH